MSFLSGIYSKVWGTNAKKDKDLTKQSDATSRFYTEDIDNDGFVLYTVEQQNKRYKLTEDSRSLNENIQQSCPYTSGSVVNSVTQPRGHLYQKKEYTFLTVSDVPMELSKPLQIVLNFNQMSCDVHRKSSSFVNTEQYNYDFSLERTVLSHLPEMQS